MLKEMLPDWRDFDVAAHAVAVSFGLMPADWDWVLVNAKRVFWTDNPTGNMLHNVLELLVEAKVLEKNEDDQYRYNREFTAHWNVEGNE